MLHFGFVRLTIRTAGTKPNFSLPSPPNIPIGGEESPNVVLLAKETARGGPLSLDRLVSRHRHTFAGFLLSESEAWLDLLKSTRAFGYFAFGEWH